MPENSSRLGIPLPLGNETVSRANRRAEMEAIDANAAALGLNNQALNKVKAALLEVDTRGTTYAHNAISGYLETITEKDGVTTVKTTAFTYNGDGTLNTVAETAGGVTVTTTFVYTDGKLTSDSKVVA